MTVYPDFNLGQWQERFNTGYEAPLVGRFGYGSIDPVTIPYVFNEQYIRVLLTADYKKQSWKQAAIVHQTIPTFLGNDDVISEHLILLDKPEILDLIQYPDGYRLKFNIFNWFRDINIQVHAWRNGV